MNYYPHHIGDFNNATRHLTRVERALYRDLIELYYDTEQPLPADDFDRLARRVIAVTEEEKAALKYVLEEFFTLDGDVYRHERCELEIEKYRTVNNVKSKAGKASAEARKKKAAAKKQPKPEDIEHNLTGVEQVLNTCATNQEPRTKNQYIKDSSLNAHDQNSPPADNSGTQSDNSGQQPNVDNSHNPADDSCTGEQLAFDAQYLKLARATGISADHSDADIRAIFDLFRCYKANANTHKTQSDWLGAWRTWCQREKVNYAKSNQKTGTGYAGQRPENNVQRALRVAQQAAERLAATGNDNCGLAPD